MDKALFDELERRVEAVLDGFAAIKEENSRLRESNRQLLDQRDELKGRIDAILQKLEGIQSH